MGNPNRQPYHCREGEYARACADPTKRPPHHTDGGPVSVRPEDKGRAEEAYLTPHCI